MVFIDIESYSELDIREVGAYVYWAHPSTRILVLCWAEDDGPVRTWTWLDGTENHVLLPPTFVNQDIVAHNVEFEKQALTRFGLAVNCRWHDTAAQAAMCALPRGLEKVGAALGLPIQKNKRGSYLISKLSKPQRPSKTNPHTEPHLRWPDYVKLLNEFASYCETDVEVCREVHHALPKLPPTEAEIFDLTMRINERGICIDLDAVRAAMAFVERVTGNRGDTIRALTGFSHTQVAELLNWVNDRVGDNPLASLDKAAVSAALRRKHLPPEVREALEIRQELAKSSTAKLDSILQRVSADGRVRGSIMYHGAGTGRWAGAGIQPQNMPQSKGWDMEDCIAAIHGNDAEWIDMVWGKPVPAFVSQSLRGMLIAPPGKVLVGADFSQIEARVVLWLAKDPGLELFASGADIYMEMADDIDPAAPNRQLGKQAILGCFGGDTPVLTKRGWTPLQNLTPHDILWDGTEWVSHGGLLCQGLKDTINLLGVQSTPDHQILTCEGWVPAYQVAHGDTRHQQSALSLGNFGLKGMNSDLGAGLSLSECPAHAAGTGFTPWTQRICAKALQLGAMLAQKSKATKLENTTGATPTSCPTIFTGSVCSTASARYLAGATIRAVLSFPITAGAAFLSITLGALTGGLFWRTSSACPSGKTPHGKLTESTWTGGTNRGICASPQEPRTWQTGGKSAACSGALANSNRKTLTYDIAFCGPRNRYTILTDAGPLIVHNCGFGMGVPKFADTCARYGIEVSDELADRAVKAYRAKFFKVPQLWRALEQAAIAAVKNPGVAYQTNPDNFVSIRYQMEGIFLTCTLPSGRKLYFPYPQLEEGKYGEQLTYMGVDSTTKAWRREHTYGGKLTENVVQAIARDLMALALLRLEDAGYPVVMTVHDEAVCEVDEDTITPGENVVRLMCESPYWAAGLPVEAEGFIGSRYS